MTATLKPRRNYRATFCVLALAGVSYGLLQSLVAPALPVIKEELHTTQTGATWVLTSFLMASAVLTPISGRLGDMFGKKRVMMIALSVMCVGLVISAVSTTLAPTLFGRVIQGAGGAIFPLSFGIVRDEVPRVRLATGFAVMSGIFALGGSFGMILSGPITDNLSYHWLFWLPCGMLVIAMSVAYFVVPESRVKTPGAVHYKGAAALATWLVCLLLGVSQGGEWGWTDPRVLVLFVLAVVFVVVWVRVETRTDQPLIDMRMMRRRGVWTANAFAVTLGIAMLSTGVLVPPLAQTPSGNGFGFGASVTEVGLILLPSGVAMGLASMVSGRIARAIGTRFQLVAGGVFITIGFVQLALAHETPLLVCLGMALTGIGLGLGFAAMPGVISESTDIEQMGAANGMNTVFRVVGMAFGGQVAASILVAHTVDGLASEQGYVVGFGAAAAIGLVSIVLALFVPARRHAGAMAESRAGDPSLRAA